MFSKQQCRKARIDRNHRYDGLFFSAAATTKIYCRPICPGRPPLASNAVYFSSSAAAQAAGFRPCLRCRPELAPGHLVRTAQSWKIRHLLNRIHRGVDSKTFFRDPAIEADSQEQACTSAFRKLTGVSAPAYLSGVRFDFAKMLLSDTDLPLSGIARASGFPNARALQDTLSQRYGQDILAYRKPLAIIAPDASKACTLQLTYRPPFDWSTLLDYFAKRAINGVEYVEGNIYYRSFRLAGQPGWFSVRHMPNRNGVLLEAHNARYDDLMQIVWRVRRMFDLDADLRLLDSLFRKDALLGPAWTQHPGLRVPVGWDAFEFAVRAIVGQLISVAAATAIMGRISDKYSDRIPGTAPKGIRSVFPLPATLLNADLRSCGLTHNKAAAIKALARAVLSNAIELELAGDLDDFVRRSTALRGIGDWTAQTIAMRGMGHPDAFPAGDLGIVKSLSATGQKLKPGEIRAIAERWRPWRAYAAMLFWMG